MYKENRDKKAMTYEFVSPMHPDKICDQIADAILDDYLSSDPDARVAIEVMGGHGKIKITGEISTKWDSNLSAQSIEEIVREIAGYAYEVEIFTSKQSREIARGVDSGGAGDQGIMIGYACSDTDTHMPRGYEIARQLCRDIYEHYPHDGKVQVTISGDSVLAVVASFQHTRTEDLDGMVRQLISANNYFINPAGEWITGGFDADSGLSGRKIVIDNYGPEVPVGGGSFSGKDLTKVDRSGAYMARKIAVDLLKQKEASEVLVKLGYVIGVTEPVMAVAKIDGVLETVSGYDLTPKGIIKTLNIGRPLFYETAKWGHFGRGFRWDK
ncbi:MAG: hypothetical protein A2119_02455 [Candidatus Colwellbacteria bacterium GWA2_46_10]|nr:MAG: S-adenosylmethionine synthase [Parcubacteria group bacterium GW2011_GWA2_46_10]OGY56386.1 MAG: hypothetical protein A2119_02455 [Candidatus Colwellbacteria bacterium GWA2_46_10]